MLFHPFVSPIQAKYLVISLLLNSEELGVGVSLTGCPRGPTWDHGFITVTDGEVFILPLSSDGRCGQWSSLLVALAVTRGFPPDVPGATGRATRQPATTDPVWAHETQTSDFFDFESGEVRS